MSNRRQSRERVLEALYAKELSDNDAAEILSGLIHAKLDSLEECRFAEKAFLSTVKNRQYYDELIEGQLKNYDIHRLALVDKIILRMALNEFLEFEDIPVKVTINEAIDLAKKYSTAKSGYFVNGILDAVSKELEQNKKILKKGRGLLERTV